LRRACFLAFIVGNFNGDGEQAEVDRLFDDEKEIGYLMMKMLIK
jgi:hypothetical protein